jgi:hypothetical protein
MKRNEILNKINRKKNEIAQQSMKDLIEKKHTISINGGFCRSIHDTVMTLDFLESIRLKDRANPIINDSNEIVRIH